MKRRVPVIYNDRDTVLHRRDPRAKLIVLALAMLYLYLAPDWRWMLAGAGAGLGMALVARVPGKWLAALFLVQIPNATTYLLFPVVTRVLAGQPALAGSYDFALKVVFSWWVALFASMSLFTTMTLTELTDGLRGLGVPEVAVFTFQYVLLLFYLTLSDLFRVMDAMTVKGVAVRTRNPLRLARNLPKLGIPMFITVLQRANTMMAALRMRGYNFRETPELRTDLSLDAGDAALVAVVGVVVATAGAVEFAFVEEATLIAAGRSVVGWLGAVLTG